MNLNSHPSSLRAHKATQLVHTHASLLGYELLCAFKKGKTVKGISSATRRVLKIQTNSNLTKFFGFFSHCISLDLQWSCWNTPPFLWFVAFKHPTVQIEGDQTTLPGKQDATSRERDLLLTSLPCHNCSNVSNQQYCQPTSKLNRRTLMGLSNQTIH